MQRGFFYRLENDDIKIYTDYNFVPSSLRRAIAMLGFIHERLLGICHPLFAQILPYSSDPDARFHMKTLVNHFEEMRALRNTYDNSIWIYILEHSCLPQDLVDTEYVHTFQAQLNQLAKMRAERQDPNRRESYPTCADVMAQFHANTD